MASTPRDQNRIATLIGTLQTDGSTIVSIKVNSATNSIKMMDGTTGSSFAETAARRDDNRVATIWGVSSADGTTPLYIAADANGNLLCKST